jgi:hypothetical protein
MPSSEEVRVQRRLDPLEPGDVGMPSVEVAAHRFYQDGERGDLLQSAGIPPREDPFHPAILLLVVGTLRLARMRRFYPWRIQAARTVGMTGVPLPLGLEGCYPCLARAHPFGLLLNDRYQVDHQPPFSCSIAAQRLLAGDQVGHLPLQHSHLVLLLRHQRMRPLSTQRGQVFRSNHGRP